MANITINTLPPVTSLNGTEQFPLDQTAVTLQTTLNAMGNFILNSANTVSTAGNITSNATISAVAMIASSSISAPFITGNTITAGNLVATNISGNIANTTGGYGNTNVNMLLGNLGVDIIPSANNVTSLGNATNQFKDLYLSNATLYFDSVPVSVAGTTLQVNGENVVTTSAGNTTTQGNINVSGNITAENVIGNVAVANVVGLGNIATVNLNNNGAQYLAGNGAWVTPAAGYSNANVAAYLPVNTSNVAGNNFTASGFVNVGSLGSQIQLLSYTANATTVTFDLMGMLPPPFSAGQTMLISGIQPGEPTELNGYWPVVSCDGLQVVITCNLQPTLPLGFTSVGQVVNLQNVSATGNITGRYILGNGSQLTGLPASYANADVSTYLASGTDTANIVTTGNVQGGNIKTAGIVSATGNVTGAYILGNISQATGLGNIVSTNLNGNGTTYLAGNGSWQPITTSNYGDANVAAYLPTNTADVNAGNLTTDANAAIHGDATVGLTWGPVSIVSVVSSTPTTVTLRGLNQLPFPIPSWGRLLISGATGGQSGLNGMWDIVSVSAPNFVISNSSQPTAGMTGGASCIVYYGGDLTATGNISATYFLGNGSQLTGFGNVSTLDLNGNGTTYLAGNGAWQTVSSGGTPTQIANGTSSVNIPTADANIVATIGNIAWDLNADGNTVIPGNILGVPGGYNQPNFIQPNSADTSWALGIYSDMATDFFMQAQFYGQGEAGRGFRVYDNSNSTVPFRVDGTGTTTVDGTMSVTGDVTANSFIGDGSQLTGLPAGYSDANVSTYLASGNNTAGYSTTGNVTATAFTGNGATLINLTGSNVVGFVANATLADTANVATLAYGVALANVTGAGNIASINLNGNATSVLSGNGTWIAQDAFNYSNANVSSYLASGTNTAGISTTGNITANNFIANTSFSITGNVGTGNISGANNISGINLIASNLITAGATITQLPNTVASFGANVDSYAQINFQNLSNGTNAETDIVVTADNGSDTTNYGVFGIVNSGYDNATPTNSLGNIVWAADSFLYAQGNTSNTSQAGGNLAVGTTTVGKSVKIFAGGANTGNIIASFANNNVSMSLNGTKTMSLTPTGPLSLGYNAGTNLQQTGAVAIGVAAAPNAQSTNTVAIGASAAGNTVTATSTAASVSGTAMSITGTTTGSFAIGMIVTGTGFSANTSITSIQSTTIGSASISGTALSLLSVSSGTVPISVGAVISGAGVTAGTTITARTIATMTTSTISGTTLTVGAASGDPVAVGMYITGSGVTAGTYITALGTGTGGAGTYTVSVSQTVASATLTGSAYTVDQSQTVGPVAMSALLYSVSPSQTVSSTAITGTQGQGTGSVAIGQRAGNTTQGTQSVAIGQDAGSYVQGNSAVAIGQQAGVTSQSNYTVAVGAGAGNVSQSQYSVAVGYTAGATTQGGEAVAIGWAAGSASQGAQAIAIGSRTGSSSQGSGGVAIGYFAGATQGSGGVAIGSNAGRGGQAVGGVAIGQSAGNVQNANAVAIGYATASVNQGANSIAMGTLSAQSYQGANAVSLGWNTAKTWQGNTAIAIGTQAGLNAQRPGAVAIGVNAGQTGLTATTDAGSISATTFTVGGNVTGNFTVGMVVTGSTVASGTYITGLGTGTGGTGTYTVSTSQTVATTSLTAYTAQGNNAVAIGNLAGQTTQGANSIAIGWQAGANALGNNAIAIGYLAGNASQVANSIAINASATALNPTTSGFYVNPVRNDTGNTSVGVFYNTTTKELTYANVATPPASTIAAANTKVQLNNITAQIGGTPTRLYMGTVAGNMTVAGQTQTMLSGSTATSSWINVPLQSGVGNEFAVGGALSQNGELTVFNFTDQGAGTGSWRVTAIIANTTSNLYSVTIEKLA